MRFAAMRDVLTSLTMLAFFTLFQGSVAAAPVKSLPPVLSLETYKANGELLSRRELGAGDPIYQRLKTFLAAEDGKWARSRVSYKTGPFILRGEGLIVRCYPDMIIVDVLKQKGSTSYKKTAPNLLADLGLPAN